MASPARTTARTTAGDVTRARIVDAALQTIRERGVVGTSARTIARAGGFNQALIFYHFGSVHDVLLAAVERISEQRMDRYQERLAPVDTLGQLISVGAQCHAEDVEEGNIRVLSQMLAAASSSPELTEKLRSFFDPWVELVEQAVSRVVAGTPYEQVVPVHDLSMGVVALFMGTELLSQVYDTQPSATALFRTMGQLATLLEGLLNQKAAEPHSS
jgi:AcrR family transcriptional regulator